MPDVTIVVTTTAKNFMVHLNGKELRFDSSGEALARSVPSGVAPIVWHFVGKPKATISIEARTNATTIWKLEKDSIPEDREMGWGLFDLKVP